MFFALLGVTVLIFRKLGRERALALGLMVSQRNMGLMLAATAGRAAGGNVAVFRALPVSDLYHAAPVTADRAGKAV